MKKCDNRHVIACAHERVVVMVTCSHGRCLVWRKHAVPCGVMRKFSGTVWDYCWDLQTTHRPPGGIKEGGRGRGGEVVLAVFGGAWRGSCGDIVGFLVFPMFPGEREREENNKHTMTGKEYPQGSSRLGCVSEKPKRPPMDPRSKCDVVMV